MITATILTIGDEILIGQITDTNSAFLARALNKIGIKVIHMASCSDSKNDILNTLKRCLRRSEIVITTGGLGPTKDDITKNVLMTLSLSNKYVRSQKQYNIIKNLLSARGIQMLDINRQQAYVPENCTVIPNRIGTAPIMQFNFKKERFGKDNLLFSLPGVPFETEYATEDVISAIQAHYKLDKIFHRTICTFGIAESVLSKKIEKWEDSLPANLHLAYLPNPILGVRLRLSIYGIGEKEGKEELDKYASSLKTILGDAVYGEGDTNPQTVAGELLLERGATISTAESCTGGYLAHLLTEIPGSSRYFWGSVVSYDNSVKINTLGVHPGTIKMFGAVSSQCVKEMAEGVRKKLGTTYSISTSGIAGPSGATPGKPVGTLWMAVSGPKGTVTSTIVSKSTRKINIERFAASALDLFRKSLISGKI
ncbi:MAG: CinA family nicotinamide mononucleotide deamidase-related protein [Bacteroidales bacterium]|jgi:nicotinamide-nucleotide amidase|nr:CinA family nicotinamide mononucleotide deamidase-related protein [Bacteroidales bacterium]